ncbi:methyltransferase domain-containing protein [Mucilaginibacter polytrichastri]|uniref:methyltransferase domain-containing protein n=1 Tax=Mucilaginibacter polytrichastri TaxID=1302689 RepID=UPI0015C58170
MLPCTRTLPGLLIRIILFDLCLSFEDLEHIPDYKQAVSELYRVTKTGGHVFFEYPIYY